MGPFDVRTCSLVSGFSDDLTAEEGLAVVAVTTVGAFPSRKAFSLADLSARSFLSACNQLVGQDFGLNLAYLDLSFDSRPSFLIFQLLPLFPICLLERFLDFHIFLHLSNILPISSIPCVELSLPDRPSFSKPHSPCSPERPRPTA